MDQTLLIGLDGATFTVLDPLMEEGDMPFLRDFLSKGVRAKLLSTPNPLTPPAWVSMITGRSPGNHGIFDFIWAEQRKADHYFTLYNFRDIQCETIWSIVSRQQGRVGSLNFTMMSPPPPVLGYIVPGLVSWKHMRRNVYPRELYSELQAIPGFNVKEVAWDFDLEKKAERGIPEEEYENWIRFHIRRENQWFEILRYLMKHHPCHLTAILLDGMDKILHMGWRFLDPESSHLGISASERNIRNLCVEYFCKLDRFLEDLVTLAGPDARVFLASDHGFGPSQFVFRANVWLHEHGYLTWRNLDDLDEKDREGARRLVDRHFVLLDWDRTTAYARTVTSNGIYIRVAQRPGEPGVPVDQYESFRKELMEKLLDVQEPETGERVIQRILTKEEAFPGDHNDQAPDLTLVMADYSFISILNKAPAVLRRPHVDGTHYPEGIFVAAGKGIRKGTQVPRLSILDVAPILLYSLGLEIPMNFEGHLPEEIFEPSHLREYLVRIGAPTQPPDSNSVKEERQATSEDEEKQIFEQMRALGYLE
jgi:predicted AlkP superfamily phosphohydrolase/phosphomutase